MTNEIKAGYWLCKIKDIPYTPYLVLRYDGEFWLQYCCIPGMRGWLGVDFEFEPIKWLENEP